MTRARIKIPHANIAAFCQRHHIHRLALFGSVLRDDFRSESDIDVLVEFEPSHAPGLIRLAGMELELSDLLGGRRVDLNTSLCLSPYFRDEVLAEAEVLYVHA
jgi:predicted nucleotidyltransferase